jgi:hypothetical protein
MVQTLMWKQTIYIVSEGFRAKLYSKFHLIIQGGGGTVILDIPSLFILRAVPEAP